MNYEPNIISWQVGDLVIHDADAKQEHMLMRVTGFTRDGLVKTMYHRPGKDMPPRQRKKVWRNELKYLHDPNRFGIEVRNSNFVRA